MSTDSKSVRAAIVGCGRISLIHIAAIREAGPSEIVAVCDLNQDAAEARAQECDIPAAYSDVGRMLAETSPDVVHVLTPPGSHVALVEQIAAAGAHAYVEKPLASTESEARAVLDAARNHGVLVCPGHNRLFDPDFLDAERRIRAGEIGRVVSVRAEQGFSYESAARSSAVPWSYRDEWGIFENLMPHPLYLVSHFLKDPGEPQVVGFNLDTVREAAVEEIRVLVPSRGAVGEVSLSMNIAPETNRVEIIGTRGRILVDIVSLSVLTRRKGALPSAVYRLFGSFDISRQLIGATASNLFGIVTGRLKRYPGIRGLVREFYRSIREGTEAPVSPESGLLNARQLERIREACRSAVKPRARTAPLESGPRPSVLVTGASGFVGGHLVRRLSEAGTSCRAITRVPLRATPRDGVEWAQANLESEDDLRRVLEGVETVHHCAALVGSPGTLEDYERTNVDSAIRLAELAAEAGVRRLVFLSSIGVYGMPGSSPYIDEDFAYDRRAAERGFYTQTKLAADRALIEWGRSHDTPRVVLLRAGTIYGPGAPLPLGRLPLLKGRHRPVVAGSRGVAMPLTYVDNVVDAMSAATAADVPGGSVFNIVDSADVDQGEVGRALSDLTDGRVRTFCVPAPLVWPLMLGIDLLGVVRHRKIGTARYRLARTLANMRYRCDAARRDLDWAPGIDLREGLGRVLASERETPFPH